MSIQAAGSRETFVTHTACIRPFTTVRLQQQHSITLTCGLAVQQ